MFKALIIACILNNPDSCIQVTDTYGPYTMEGRCKTRLEEMEYQLNIVWVESKMPFQIIERQCVVVSGKAT